MTYTTSIGNCYKILYNTMMKLKGMRLFFVHSFYAAHTLARIRIVVKLLFHLHSIPTQPLEVAKPSASYGIQSTSSTEQWCVGWWGPSLRFRSSGGVFLESVKKNAFIFCCSPGGLRTSHLSVFLNFCYIHSIHATFKILTNVKNCNGIE